MAFENLTWINWTALANADQSSEPWIYYHLEAGVGLTPLLATVTYLSQHKSDALTASGLAESYRWFFGSCYWPSKAFQKNTNIEAIEVPNAPLPTSSSLLFSFGPPVAALFSAPASQRQLSSPTPPVVTFAVVPSGGTSVPLIVVEPLPPVVARFAIRLPQMLAHSLKPGPTGVSLAVPLCLVTQTPFAVPSHFSHIASSNVTAATGASPGRQLTKVKRQSDADHWDLAISTLKLHEMRDKNEGVRFSLPALRDAFQVMRLPLVVFMSQFHSVFTNCYRRTILTMKWCGLSNVFFRFCWYLGVWM